MNMYQGVKTYTFTTTVKIQENMWNLKINTNELIYRTETDIENKCMVTKRKGGGGIN